MQPGNGVTERHFANDDPFGDKPDEPSLAASLSDTTGSTQQQHLSLSRTTSGSPRKMLTSRLSTLTNRGGASNESTPQNTLRQSSSESRSPIPAPVVAHSHSQQQQQPPAVVVTQQQQKLIPVSQLRDIVSVNIVSSGRKHDHTEKKDITFYDVCTTTTSASNQQQQPQQQPWAISHRFSDFVAFDEYLSERIFTSANGFPPAQYKSKCDLPSKFQLGSTQSDEFVSKRRGALTTFLQNVLAYAKSSEAELSYSSEGGAVSRKLLEAVVKFLGGPRPMSSAVTMRAFPPALQQTPSNSSAVQSPLVGGSAATSGSNFFGGGHTARSSVERCTAATTPPYQCLLDKAKGVFACVIAFSSIVVEVTVTPENAEDPSCRRVIVRGKSTPSAIPDLKHVLPAHVCSLLYDAKCTVDELSSSTFLDFEFAVDVPGDDDFNVSDFTIEFNQGSVVVLWRKKKNTSR